MPPRDRRRLIVVSAPSGAGKTTIVKRLMEAFPEMVFSVSACSRARRPNEIHGKDYYFISTEEFREKIAADEFLEWEEVYKGHYYGTLKTEVDRIVGEGRPVIFDVDVKGGLNIKRIFGSEALALFIMPPGLKTLEERLRARATDSEESIRRRLKKAGEEMEHAGDFDHVIVNDKLEKAVADAIRIVKKFLGKVTKVS
jgi:guanylate kinase